MFLLNTSYGSWRFGGIISINVCQLKNKLTFASNFLVVLYVLVQKLRTFNPN